VWEAGNLEKVEKTSSRKRREENQVARNEEIETTDEASQITEAGIRGCKTTGEAQEESWKTGENAKSKIRDWEH